MNCFEIWLLFFLVDRKVWKKLELVWVYLFFVLNWVIKIDCILLEDGEGKKIELR